MSKMSPERSAWYAMKRRCFDRSHESYDRYGGRGITVCEAWVHSFDAFYHDVGPRPGPEYSLDRYPDNNGNYQPGNVRWATRTEQMRNTRHNRILTFQGQSRTMVEWAEIIGIAGETLRLRLTERGSVERTLAEPAMTNAECLQRATAAYTTRLHCKHGHAFTEENTHIDGGRRVCRACQRNSSARYRAKRRQAGRMTSRALWRWLR